MVASVLKIGHYPREGRSHRSLFLLPFVFCLLVYVTTWADDPVFMPDPLLKTCIEEALGLPDPMVSDMLALTSLHCNRLDVEDLTGLEQAENLQSLTVSNGLVVQIEPLSQLHKLETLNISNNRISDLSPLSGLSQLHYLNVHENKIKDFSPLAGLHRLESLVIRENRFSDISPLANLTSLKHLDLNEGDHLTDISPLAGLENLEQLFLSNNRLRDISALAQLGKLRHLELRNNNIQDIKALSRLIHLQRLDLRQNSNLPNEAYSTHLHQIMKGNPGIILKYSPNTRRPRGVVASQGTDPDRIVVTWDEVPQGPIYPSFYQVTRTDSNGVSIRLCESWQATTTFIDTNALLGEVYAYRIQGSTDEQGLFKTELSVSVEGWRPLHPAAPSFFVDDNAPHDPGPNTIQLSDPAEDGTIQHPFDSIQEVIDLAAEGSVIKIQPGTYYEAIDFQGKALELRGADPNTRLPFPIIDGHTFKGPVVRLAGPPTAISRLSGLTVMGGNGVQSSAVFCSKQIVILDHCLLVGNRATDPFGATIHGVDASLLLTHCTVANNLCGDQGAALVADDSDIHMVNTIFAGNIPAALRYHGDGEPEIRYCTITGDWPQGQLDAFHDRGNIDQDPLFAQAGYWLLPDQIWIPGDYHLLSVAGRWDPGNQTWIQDPQFSPCIDAGDPEVNIVLEPWPHGHIVNSGVYGGTAQASRSDCLYHSEGQDHW